MGIIIGWLLALVLLVAVSSIILSLVLVLVNGLRLGWDGILALHEFGKGLTEDRKVYRPSEFPPKEMV